MPRHAKIIADVATLAKLIALVMNKADTTVDMEQVDNIKAFIRNLKANPLSVPRLVR